MKVMQLEDGAWFFRVNSANPKTGYSWSRGNGPTRVETFVSASSDALWFDADTELQKISQSFSSRAEFLAWACQELGSGTVYVWELTSQCEKGTYNCATGVGSRH